MYYFAYGSELNRRQMLKDLPAAKPLFSATLSHYRLIFTGWSRQHRGGMASIKPMRGEKVAGGIYELTDADFRRMDKNKGVPDTYDKINVIVHRETGEAVEAVTYIMHRQTDEAKPTAEYLAIIRQGYQDWGLI